MPVNPSRFHSERLAIVGLGLIGCSWVKGLREQGCVRQVSGYDLNPESMRLAAEHGIIDEYSTEIEQVVPTETRR